MEKYDLFFECRPSGGTGNRGNGSGEEVLDRSDLWTRARIAHHEGRLDEARILTEAARMANATREERSTPTPTPTAFRERRVSRLDAMRASR